MTVKRVFVTGKRVLTGCESRNETLPSTVTTHCHTQLMYRILWRFLENERLIAASSDAGGHCDGNTAEQIVIHCETS